MIHSVVHDISCIYSANVNKLMLFIQLHIVYATVFFVRVKGTTRLTRLGINPSKTALLYISLYMHMKNPYNVSAPSDAVQQLQQHVLLLQSQICAWASGQHYRPHQTSDTTSAFLLSCTIYQSVLHRCAPVPEHRMRKERGKD